MFLLIIAGISLGATAVQWWNEDRTEKVNEQICILREEYQKICAANNKVRKKMLMSYVLQLESFVRDELIFRDQVFIELKEALDNGRKCLTDGRGKKNPFGSVDETTFYQLLVELEQAVYKIEAEKAFYSDALTEISLIKDGRKELNSFSGLILPVNFPVEGGLVQLELGTKLLHGYRLDGTDEGLTSNSLVALYNVDHETKRAKTCPAKAKLLTALLRESQQGVEAIFKEWTESFVMVEIDSLILRLPSDRADNIKRMLPGDTIKIYPNLWTIEKVLSADRKKYENSLIASSIPRLFSKSNYWSPIPVKIFEWQLNILQKGFAELENNKLTNKPWKISLGPSGENLFFSLGKLNLELSIDSVMDCFVLKSIKLERLAKAEVSVSLHAELSCFLSGSGDEKNDWEKGKFIDFLKIINSELSTQKYNIIQRRTALQLRKLSTIYQDQINAEEQYGSCPIFTVSYEVVSGQHCISFLILGQKVPEWFYASIDCNRPKLKAVSQLDEYNIIKLSAVDQKTKYYKIFLSVDGRGIEEKLRKISRIVHVTGMQQRTLIRALEDTIYGSFVSPTVRSNLLNIQGESSPNTIEGPDASMANAMLTSDVFAVWGPPGTGKTTFVVSFILNFINSFENKKPQILITAPTHVAVNEILARLIEKKGELVNFSIRYATEEKLSNTSFGNISRDKVISEMIQNIVDFDGPCEQKIRTKWLNILENGQNDQEVTRWLLTGRHIHAATSVGMAKRSFALMDQNFDLVIFDEAGKAFSAEILIPSIRAKKLIIVGDHKQLPPTITEDVLNSDNNYRLDIDEVEQLLRQNMFSQLFDKFPSEKKGLLNTQYRMHKDLGKMVSHLFYDGKLKNGPQKTCPFFVKYWPLKKRIIIADYSKKNYRSERKNTSQINHSESDSVLRFLTLLSKHFSGNLPQILIVCPYGEQRKLVAKKIEKILPNNSIKTTTVDAVQGGESTIVLLLMTRTFGGTQFLLDENRFNVAISRAKEAVVIFGDSVFLSKGENSPFKRLLTYGKSENLLQRMVV